MLSSEFKYLFKRSLYVHVYIIINLFSLQYIWCNHGGWHKKQSWTFKTWEQIQHFAIQCHFSWWFYGSSGNSGQRFFSVQSGTSKLCSFLSTSISKVSQCVALSSFDLMHVSSTWNNLIRLMLWRHVQKQVFISQQLFI